MIKASTLVIGMLVVVAMVMITSVIIALAPYVVGLICLIVLIRYYFHCPTGELKR
jgi:hypothetical protein